MENEKILIKLEQIEKFIIGLKDVLNSDELSEYTGFKRSYIYKLVHEKKIPHSKPNNGNLFFERKRIDAWLLGNPGRTNEEIRNEALRRIRKK